MEYTDISREEFSQELLKTANDYAEKYGFSDQIDGFEVVLEHDAVKKLTEEGKEDTRKNRLEALAEIDKDEIAQDYSIMLNEEKEKRLNDLPSDYDVEKSQIEEVKKMAKQNYDFGDSTTEQFIKNYQDILVMEKDIISTGSDFNHQKNELTTIKSDPDSPSKPKLVTHKIPKGIKNKNDALKYQAHKNIDFNKLAETTKSQQVILKKTETKTRFKKILGEVRELLIAERGSSKKVGNNQRMKI